MIPIKTGREIEAMRDACRAACEVLEGLESMVRPGITTKEIDAAAAEMIAERGCKSAFLGYRGLSASP
jgi:methionyl aminopeptidase